VHFASYYQFSTMCYGVKNTYVLYMLIHFHINKDEEPLDPAEENGEPDQEV
jgi:hypothetical protein